MVTSAASGYLIPRVKYAPPIHQRGDRYTSLAAALFQPTQSPLPLIFDVCSRAIGDRCHSQIIFFLDPQKNIPEHLENQSLELRLELRWSFDFGNGIVKREARDVDSGSLWPWPSQG